MNSDNLPSIPYLQRKHKLTYEAAKAHYDQLVKAQKEIAAAYIMYNQEYRITGNNFSLNLNDLSTGDLYYDRIAEELWRS